MLRRTVSVIAVVAIIVVAGAGLAVYSGAFDGPQPTRSPVARLTPSAHPVESFVPSIRPTVLPSGAPSATPTPEPSATPIDTSIHAAAVVVPLRSADLAMSLSGVVSTIYVRQNDQVIGGQLLLTLDQTKYVSDVQVAQASVDQADAAVNRATVTVNQLPSVATPGEIEAAQAELRLAQANLEVAHSQLSSAQAALRQTELRAPLAGTVTSVKVTQGEPVTAGEQIVTIGDMSTWLVETTDLSEIDVVRVAVGDRATITFTALPGVVVGGVVDNIQVRGTTDGGAVNFAVTIRPDTYLPQLRWNMSANVSIAPSG